MEPVDAGRVAVGCPKHEAAEEEKTRKIGEREGEELATEEKS